MIGALFISAVIAYFYSLPFLSLLQGGNYRVQTYLIRAERYIVFSSLYFFSLAVTILLTEWLLLSVWRYLYYILLSAVTIGVVFAVKAKMRMPLTRTKRWLRLSVGTVGLYLLFFFGLLFGRGAYLLSVTPALVPIIVPLASAIISPFEKRNNAKYILEAKKKISESHARVIGITGSYGKTSVKNDLKGLLSAKYEVLASPANYNTPLGVAKTMQGASGKEEILIFEMGARQTGDIRELCDITSPDIGIITGVAPQHLETFGSLQEIVREKESLAYAIPQEGMVFFNTTDPYVREMYERFQGNKIGVGEDKGEYLISETRVTAKGMTFRLSKGREFLDFALPIWGRAAVVDFALSAAVAWELGVDLEDLVRGGSALSPSPHRFEVMTQGDVTILDDSYNINPVGAAAALDTLSAFPAERRIVYCSGMVELGREEEELNASLGRQLASVADEVILGGGKYGEMVAAGLTDAGYPLHKIRRVCDTAEASALFKGFLKKGDVLLVMSDLPRDYLI